MNVQTGSHPSSQRQSWLAVLARAELVDLREAWVKHARETRVRYLRKPEIGLIMTRGRAGGTGAPFNLGEMTVTRCVVQLTGTDVVGYGYVGGRAPQRAELVAAFDALLQMNNALQSTVIEPLAQRQRERREEVARKVAQTRVEFFTMVRGGLT